MSVSDFGLESKFKKCKNPIKDNVHLRANPIIKTGKETKFSKYWGKS